MITPLVNKDAMMLHLELISLATESDRHAVVIVDGAGWHTMDTAMPFSNLTLIKLPAYSPELNPMEQVWQWLRQHCLSNRVFDCYEQIVEQVSRAWNTFVEDTGRVKSLCSRDWINLTDKPVKPFSISPQHHLTWGRKTSAHQAQLDRWL
ncbi:transposase [Shewanella algae]|nr:transposase [Shewanella algae]